LARHGPASRRIETIPRIGAGRRRSTALLVEARFPGTCWVGAARLRQ
jgi:hypothetical protein